MKNTENIQTMKVAKKRERINSKGGNMLSTTSIYAVKASLHPKAGPSKPPGT